MADNGGPAVSVSPFREFWDPQSDVRPVCFTPFGGSSAINVLDYYPVELPAKTNVKKHLLSFNFETKFIQFNCCYFRFCLLIPGT